MSLQVGKVIFDILSNDQDLTQRVDSKIFPLVAENNTTFPFIVYKRTGIEPQTSKDKLIHKEETNVEVNIMSDTYNDSIEVADLVKTALTGKKGIFSGIAVQDIIFTDASEDFQDDTFIQNLTFKIINIYG